MGSVRAGAVRWPLPDKEQRLPAVVQLHLEELVLLVRQLDAQKATAVCGGHILLGTHHPAALVPALPLPGAVEQFRRGLVFGRDTRPGHLKDQLGGTRNLGGRVSLGVVSRRPEGESGLGAAGVGVVPVDSLPLVLARLKGEVSAEKKDIGSSFAVPTDPAAS